MNSESANSKRTQDVSLTWNDQVVARDDSSSQRETLEAPAAPQADKPRKRTSAWGVMFDSMLVMGLLGGIGAGAWYIMQELDRYHIPSPMELAQNEHLELCKKHEKLQNAAYQADEQLRMQARIAALDSQVAGIRRQIAERRQSIREEEARILSLQKEIRQEDRTSRAVARSLMIGLPIGNAATTTGRTFPNAVIHRLQAGRITLRFPSGQTTFPISQLVKDTLPDIVRYALGVDDMVDMSDFDKAPRRRKGKLILPRKAPVNISTEPVSYEPAAGSPVVNTQAPATITVSPGPEQQEEADWEAPEAPLPIEP